MSKLKTDTKSKIRDKALEMFNERGIEYVGLRELAAILNMRVSNITYYFPTKDDLVYEISMGLNQANSAVMVANDHMTVRLFIEMMYKVFQNHVRYRCLLLSFVHIMEQNKVIASQYKNTQSTRNKVLKENIDAMARSGYLLISDGKDAEFLVSSIALISRFWISEAAVSFRKLSDEEQIEYYLSMIKKILSPYLSAKGRRDIGQLG
ncbi:MAG TPA: TetR/AcrR family transcriptional regulator [Flavitalea sp.]|nr:TetR/AcrR family transcriptional regulator [Flavitalea sp.]